MDWHQLIQPKRFGIPHTDAITECGRSHFHKDYDRIIFSGAFRRLNKKTQVHPLNENDHIHARLTHSLEVASVGRTLGTAVGEAMAMEGALPERVSPDDLGAIVQAACLAHDIGNPPFGHAGEQVISEWFRYHWADSRFALIEDQKERTDLCHFEGNAQGLRLVSRIERHYKEGGLRLTYPTLGTLLKYPWSSTHVTSELKKFNCFSSEATVLEEVAEQLGLTPLRSGVWSRHPLSYLVEAADDICYAFIDLEDALEIGILTLSQLEWVASPLYSKKTLAEFGAHSTRSLVGLIRSRTIGYCIEAVVAAFLSQQTRILEGTLHGSLINYTHEPVRASLQRAKEVANKEIFPRAKIALTTLGAEDALHTLLDLFTQAVFKRFNRHPLNQHEANAISLLNSNCPTPYDTLYEHYRCVLDYLSGMTDAYALRLADELRPKPRRQWIKKLGAFTAQNLTLR